MTTNPDSILDSIKKLVGFDAEFTAFDIDVTMHINSAFGELQQFGVGGEDGFVIADNSTLWSQYISDLVYLGMVKQYIYLFVKLAFDPPVTSFALEAIHKQLEKLSWRINSAAEHITPPSDPNAETDTPVGLQADLTYFVVKTVNLEDASEVGMNAELGNTFYLSITGDATILAPVNGSDGEHITLHLTSNGHAVTWGHGWNFGTSGLPALSGGGLTDVISAVYRESAAEWYAGFTPGF